MKQVTVECILANENALAKIHVAVDVEGTSVFREVLAALANEQFQVVWSEVTKRHLIVAETSAKPNDIRAVVYYDEQGQPVSHTVANDCELLDSMCAIEVLLSLDYSDIEQVMVTVD